MKNVFLGVALFGIFLDVYLLRRLLALTHASTPMPVSLRPKPASLDPDIGFFRRFAAPAMPVILPSLTAFPLFWFAQTYEEIVLGLLLISVTISLSAPLLTAELLAWSHRAHRLDPQPEAELLERLFRLGIHAGQVWVSETPVAAFWLPSVHAPAIITGSRVLVWDRVRDLPPERLSGIALERGSALWQWSLWPVFAAVAIRLLDTASVLPWWLFAVPLALAALEALPDVLRQGRVRRRLQSDASAPDAILGFVEIELAASAFIAGRGDGPYHRLTSTSAWIAGVRRARSAATLARMPDHELDTAVAEMASRQSVET